MKCGICGSVLVCCAVLTISVGAQTWTELNPRSKPAGRMSAQMAFDTVSSRAVLFGGRLAFGAVAGDTWLWDGSNWTQAVVGNAPSPRYGFVMASDEARREVVLFGGYDASNQPLGDTWIWNGSTWTQRTLASAPAARGDAAMTYDPVRRLMVLFAGVDSSGSKLSDTWTWDGTGWTRLTPSASPSPRSKHQMAWDASNQGILMLGGEGTADTWVWNGTTWTDKTPPWIPVETFLRLAVVSHAGAPLLVYGPAALWDGKVWQPVAASSASPYTLTEAAAVWDPVRNRTLVFGGWDLYSPSTSVLSSMWSLELGTGCVFGWQPQGGWLPGEGGSLPVYLPLQPGCAWTASTGEGWLSITPTAGTGSSVVVISASANAGTAARDTTVRIGGQDVGVSQSGCQASLDAAALSAPAGRTAAAVQVYSGCTWRASSDASWVQVYPLTGSGSAAVQYTVFPNFSTQERSATLTVGGQPFRVTQAGAAGTPMQRFVRLLYFNFFGRTASDAEVQFQVNSGLSREQLALNFFNSTEFTLGGRYVAGLYVGLLNRDAEYGGWLFQRDALAAGAIDSTTAARNFLTSPEFSLRFGTLSDSAFVTLMYRQVLLREPTSAEVAFQVAHLNVGREAIARNMLLSQEFAIGTGPRLTAFLALACLLGREPVAAEFSSALALPPAQLLQQVIRSPEFARVVN
jgi:hypothetical protein